MTLYECFIVFIIYIFHTSFAPRSLITAFTISGCCIIHCQWWQFSHRCVLPQSLLFAISKDKKKKKFREGQQVLVIPW